MRIPLRKSFLADQLRISMPSQPLAESAPELCAALPPLYILQERVWYAGRGRPDW
jgi:hypothetical protein